MRFLQLFLVLLSLDLDCHCVPLVTHPQGVELRLLLVEHLNKLLHVDLLEDLVLCNLLFELLEALALVLPEVEQPDLLGLHDLDGVLLLLDHFLAVAHGLLGYQEFLAKDVLSLLGLSQLLPEHAVA